VQTNFLRAGCLVSDGIEGDGLGLAVLVGRQLQLTRLHSEPIGVVARMPHADKGRRVTPRAVQGNPESIPTKRRDLAAIHSTTGSPGAWPKRVPAWTQPSGIRSRKAVCSWKLTPSASVVNGSGEKMPR